MQILKDVYELLQKNPSVKDMPFYDKENNFTVCFVSPILNAEGFYKMIVPYFAFNKYHPTYRAFFTSIEGYKRNTHINDHDIQIKADVIQESDMIVFPFVTLDLEPVIKDIKEIKPDIKVAYHIDFNYYDVPEFYPFRTKYQSKKQKDCIENNIKICDKVIFTNDYLNKMVFDELSVKLKGSGTEIVTQPIFILEDFYKDIPDFESHKPENIVRIGIIVNETHYHDLNSHRDVLKKIKDAYSDNLELIVFGWDGKLEKQQKNALREIDFIFEKPVSIFDYPHKLASLELDLAFIPIKRTDFNKASKNYCKYLELASIGIPVFATNAFPFEKMIKHDETGILIDKKADWFMQMEIFMNELESRNEEEDSKFDNLRKIAYHNVWTHFNAGNETNLSILQEIYS